MDNLDIPVRARSLGRCRRKETIVELDDLPRLTFVLLPPLFFYSTELSFSTPYVMTSNDFEPSPPSRKLPSPLLLTAESICSADGQTRLEEGQRERRVQGRTERSA